MFKKAKEWKGDVSEATVVSKNIVMSDDDWFPHWQLENKIIYHQTYFLLLIYNNWYTIWILWSTFFEYLSFPCLLLQYIQYYYLHTVGDLLLPLSNVNVGPECSFNTKTHKSLILCNTLLQIQIQHLNIHTSTRAHTRGGVVTKWGGGKIAIKQRDRRNWEKGNMLQGQLWRERAWVATRKFRSIFLNLFLLWVTSECERRKTQNYTAFLFPSLLPWAIALFCIS